MPGPVGLAVTAVGAGSMLMPYLKSAKEMVGTDLTKVKQGSPPSSGVGGIAAGGLKSRTF